MTTSGIFINPGLNIIQGDVSTLNNIFRSLEMLETELPDAQTVSILLLGDSHIQAGYYSEALRGPLQQQFGSAGHGLITPLKISGTNEPPDYLLTSPNHWEGSKCAMMSPPFPVGIGGIAIRTTAQDIEFNISTPGDSFNSVRIFHHAQAPILQPEDELSTSIECPIYDTDLSTLIPLSRSVESITLHSVHSSGGGGGSSNGYGSSNSGGGSNSNSYGSSTSGGGSNNGSNSSNNNSSGGGGGSSSNNSYGSSTSGGGSSNGNGNNINGDSRSNINGGSDSGRGNLNTHIFYGFSLENGNKGVLLHTVGINGNNYEFTNRNPAIIEQSSLLAPDLIIISLGTNDSYGNFRAPNIYNQICKLLTSVQRANPNTPILLTTPMECYTRSRASTHSRSKINTNLPIVRECIIRAAKEFDLPYWDFYTVAGGQGSMNVWFEAGLANSDRIHLTRNGYHVEGKLLYNAIKESYLSYLMN